MVAQQMQEFGGGGTSKQNLGKVPKEPDVKTDSTDDPESPGTPNLKGGEI